MTTAWPGAQGAVERRHGDQEAVLLGQGLTAHPHLTILIICVRCAVCGLTSQGDSYMLVVRIAVLGTRVTLIAGLLTS